jgi:hypothetical protein
MKTLQLKDLRDLTKSKNVPSAVSTAARKLFQIRSDRH